MICKFADFTVELINTLPQTEKYFTEFLSSEQPEVSFKTSEKEAFFENQLIDGKYYRINTELVVFLSRFAEWALQKDSFLLHASLIDVGGTGVAFSALSGTGKTTHTLLWQRLLGDEMTIINGDKPIVRFFEDKQYPIGYGTPWNGKERLGTNGKIPIKHFCFIERCDTNSCEKVDPADVLDLFFKQIYLPKNDSSALLKTLSLADRFLKSVTVWKIKCNMDISAAEVAYNTIFKENNDETQI